MTLGRLEKKKMIVSYVGVPTAERGGRRRRHYLIDVEGQKALGRAFRAFTAMAEGIEAELLKCEAVGGRAFGGGGRLRRKQRGRIESWHARTPLRRWKLFMRTLDS